MATINYTVTVATGTPHPLSDNQNPTGNVYFIDGNEPVSITVNRGDTIRFDLSDPSNSGHDLRIATGTYVSGTTYSPGFTIVSDGGNPGAYVEWVVPSDAPDDMFVYCKQHGLTMGFNLEVTGTGGVQGTYNYNVTVVSGQLYPDGTGTGNVFLLNGSRDFDLNFVRGNRYVFDQSDASNAGHELLFKYEQIEDSGDFNLRWTAGVSSNGGTPGVDKITSFQVSYYAPNNMLYSCDAHGDGMGGEIANTGSAGLWIQNNAVDPNAGDLVNPTITGVTFSQQYYDASLRYNTDVGRYEYFTADGGWIQTTYAPTVSDWEGTFVNGELNSIVINGGGFDPQMDVKIVDVRDLYSPLDNPITFTYIDSTRAALTIDTRGQYFLQDGTGALIEAFRFKLTSGVTGAAGVSGEVEVDRDPEFGVAPLSTLGLFFINTDGPGQTVDVENPIVLSAIDPDDEDAVIEFAVAPNTMGFGTNRNLASDGGVAGTDPNPQNSDFSIWFEYQEPNQGIMRGAINPHSNGGPGHPYYGTNFGTSSNASIPGEFEYDHDLHVRATSTAPDGRVTSKDETFRIRAIMPWKHIANISHHFVMGGYIGAESWRVVHKCNASTDTTVSLGVQLAANGVTSPNSNRSGARYSSEGVDRWSGNVIILRSYAYGGVGDFDTYCEDYNMTTETAYNVNSRFSTDRHDLQGFSDDSRRIAYAISGNSSSTTDKLSLTTGTRQSTITISNGMYGYGAATTFTETTGYHHQWGRSSSGAPDGGYFFEFATDTHYGSWSLGAYGYAGAVGKALTTFGPRMYWLGYNVVPDCWYYDASTDTYGTAPFVQTTNNGEGNCSGGLEHGYSLGAYNGVQNNHADRINYATETLVRVATADTTGNPGSSSAAVGWVEL
jgi:hypothetical protein